MTSNETSALSRCQQVRFRVFQWLDLWCVRSRKLTPVTRIRWRLAFAKLIRSPCTTKPWEMWLSRLRSLSESICPSYKLAGSAKLKFRECRSGVNWCRRDSSLPDEIDSTASWKSVFPSSVSMARSSLVAMSEEKIVGWPTLTIIRHMWRHKSTKVIRCWWKRGVLLEDAG